MDVKLEVVIVPVSDVDRAEDFYKRLGFREDIDVGGNGYRVLQMTPPGSVHDIAAARDDLRSHGVEVSEVFHDAGGGLGGGFHVGTEGRALARLLRETSERHGAFEAGAPPHDWWDWYAAYIDAHQRGSSPEEASAAARRYMAEVKRIVVPPV